MGWASGSRLFSDVIETIEHLVPDKEVRANIYVELIDAFEAFDCDTLDECQGVDDVFDKVWEDKYPPDEDDWEPEESDDGF